jgi:hypothetical protein
MYIQLFVSNTKISSQPTKIEKDETSKLFLQRIKKSQTADLSDKKVDKNQNQVITACQK